jgi:hypothetical protein
MPSLAVPIVECEMTTDGEEVTCKPVPEGARV